MVIRIALRFAGPPAILAACTALVMWMGGFGASLARSEPTQEPPRPGASTAATAAPAPSADEKAIRAFDDAFARAYNRGDSKALAAMFTEDAETTEADGERFQGRALIGRRFAETFAASPGVTIVLEPQSIRFLGPDVAKEEGRTLINPPKEGRLVRPYTVLFVRRGGQWLLSSVREESLDTVRPHDRLEELEWMVGDWVDESPDSEVRVRCGWSEDGNFLTRSFTVRHRGKPVMSVAQRIGWDPLSRRIRSWEFDSEGGFGEGTWSRDGDRWVVKHSGVRPEGVAASATNVMIRERPDLVRWSSTDRVLGAEALPGSETYVMVRVPPTPRAPAGATRSQR